MLKRRRIWLAGLLIAASALVTGALVTAPASASVGFGNQWCYETSGTACLNAWNGGPWVKVYTARGVLNNDFTLVYNHAYGAYQLEFTANGSSDFCIGDAYNDPNNGYTSLDPCGFTGGAGWGTLLRLGNCGSNAECFIDNHWSSVQGRTDTISPVNNWSNGSLFVLNSPNLNYFYRYPAA